MHPHKQKQLKISQTKKLTKKKKTDLDHFFVNANVGVRVKVCHVEISSRFLVLVRNPKGRRRGRTSMAMRVPEVTWPTISTSSAATSVPANSVLAVTVCLSERIVFVLVMWVVAVTVIRTRIHCSIFFSLSHTLSLSLTQFWFLTEKSKKSHTIVSDCLDGGVLYLLYLYALFLKVSYIFLGIGPGKFLWAQRGFWYPNAKCKASNLLWKFF